jgi:pimeloyl-ACP methyl ester carboxylesterase
MREVMGEDSPYFPWMATNLYHHDSAMLAALLDDFEDVAAGYEAENVLPAIRCPVLLIQADPGAGSALTNAEVEQAKSMVAQLSHVYLDGVSHALHHTHPQRVAQVINEYLGSLE